MRLLILWCLLGSLSGTAQQAVLTHQIIQSADHRMGVVDASGHILIDTIYPLVALFPNGGRKVMPDSPKIPLEPASLYRVRNEAGQWGVFGANGQQIVPFGEADQVEVDVHTRTYVRVIEQEDHRFRSFLYDFDHNLLFEESFESIGYVLHADLIALIVADGQHTEAYLYNPFTRVKRGPYSHFNIYNAASPPHLGMDEQDFATFRALNVITVRQDAGSTYLWGMLDLQGNMIAPVQYTSLALFTEDYRNHPALRRAKKPDGVELLLYANLREGTTSRTFFFDRDFQRYELINDDPSEPYRKNQRIVRSTSE